MTASQLRVSVAPTSVGVGAESAATASEPPVIEKCGPDELPTLRLSWPRPRVSSSAPCSVVPPTVTSTVVSVTVNVDEPVMRPPAIERLVRLPETENAVEPLSVIPEPATPFQSSGDAPVALFTSIATPVTVAVTNEPSVSVPPRLLDCTAVQLRPSAVAGVSAAIVTAADAPPSVIPKPPTPIESVGAVSVITSRFAPVRLGVPTSTVVSVTENPAEPVRKPPNATVAEPSRWNESARVRSALNACGRIPESRPAQLSFVGGRRVVEDRNAGDGERHRVEADEGAADPVRLDRGVGGAALRDRRDAEAAAERHVDADRAVGDVVAGDARRRA